MNKKIKTIREEAVEAFNFLEDHPAFINDIDLGFLQSQSFFMYKSCKNGCIELEKSSIMLTKNDKGWEKYKNKFKNDKDFIYVSYKEHYGELWKYHHNAYCLSIDFFVFDMENKKNDKSLIYNKYDRYYLGYLKERTYEKLLIKSRDFVIETLGNYQKEDMYTKKEIDNHKKERAFFTVSVKKNSPLYDPKQKYFELKSNKKYISVKDETLNLRWLKKIVETDYFKNNWKDVFNLNLEKAISKGIC
jgi:hypothetical protein